MIEIVEAKFITSAPNIEKAPPSEKQNWVHRHHNSKARQLQTDLAEA